MRHLAAVLLGSMLGVLPTPAADSEVELTPFFGVRGGATLDPASFGQGEATADAAESFGLGVDFLVRRDARVEIFFDRQQLTFEDDSAPSGVERFDLTVDYLHAGSVYEPRREGLRPFIGAAAGLTLFDSDGARTSDSVGLSGSIGGGAKIPLGKRLALRLEGRGYATFSDTSVLATCGPGCSIQLTSDGFFQLAGRIGLTIRTGTFSKPPSRGQESFAPDH